MCASISSDVYLRYVWLMWVPRFWRRHERLDYIKYARIRAVENRETILMCGIVFYVPDDALSCIFSLGILLDFRSTRITSKRAKSQTLANADRRDDRSCRVWHSQ